MSKLNLMCVAIAVSAFSSGAFAYTNCLSGATLTYVSAGWIPTAASGENNGNAVMIGTTAGDRSFYYAGNLDDTSGRGMFSVALLALALGLPVEAWGNDYTCSNGIYELRILR